MIPSDVRMKRGKGISKWIKLSGLIYLLLIFYYEYACYAILPWTWPSSGILQTLYPQMHIYEEPVNPQAKHKVLRILLVADPQIQGNANEPQGILGTITRWDADRYLSKSFHQAMLYANPHLVIFLGDLLDEGTITSGLEYESYARRFHRLFPLSNAKVIYIPGDNDIGGEGGEPITAENIDQFRNNFPSDASSFWDTSLQFIEVSGLTDTIVLSNTSARNRPTILLGHMPVISKYPDQAALTTLEELKPALVFSAHNHKASMSSRSFVNRTPLKSSSISSEYSIFDLAPNPIGVQEIVLPTCSYRMGVPDMGYGFAIIDLTTIRLFYTVLSLPPRYPHLFVELCLTCAFCLSVLLCVVVQKCRRCRQQRGKVRFSV